MNLNRDAVIGIIVLAIILIGVIWYAAGHPFSPAGSTSTTTPTGTALGPQHISEKGDFYEIDMQYPASTALANLPDSADVNAVALMKQWELDTVADFKSGLDENAKLIADFKSRGEEVPASFENLYLDGTYQTFESNRTVSFVFTVSEYTGGAHPNGFYHTFTFDTQTGINLSLKSLFAAGTDYLGQISKIARAQLPATIAERESLPVSQIDTDMLNAGTAPTDDNFANFYLDGNNLVVLFEPYAVGPYVLGSMELDIPRTELTGLKAEYQ
jgi:hypothetical protein